MNNNTEDNWYAFGENTVGGERCPMYAATGDCPDGDWQTIVQEYDARMLDMTDKHLGIVPEEMAKDVWLGVIEKHEDQAEWHVGDRANAHELLAYRARYVASELGWL